MNIALTDTTSVQTIPTKGSPSDYTDEELIKRYGRPIASLPRWVVAELRHKLWLEAQYRNLHSQLLTANRSKSPRTKLVPR